VLPHQAAWLPLHAPISRRDIQCTASRDYALVIAAELQRDAVIKFAIVQVNDTRAHMQQ
jgi:hypothetical protein